MLNYREFITESEAEAWGEKNFPDLVSTDFKKSETFQTLFLYGGNMYKPINRVLRGEQESKDELNTMIKIINGVVVNHCITENIIVYRCVNIEIIKRLVGFVKLKKGICFSDRAFLSTSLSKNCALAFLKKYHKNCILKLYLPIGTQGAYLSYKNTISVLREQELLLAPDIEFEILKIHHFTRPKLIECVVVEK